MSKNPQSGGSAAATAASNKHTVRPGDTLGKIAQRLGVTLDALLAANPQIKNPDLIKVGQSLNVPAGTVVVPPAAPSAGGTPVATPPPTAGAVTTPPVPVAPSNSAAFAAMDKRGKSAKLHPIFVERLVMLAELLAQRGMKALITDGLRTFAEQDKLFKIGRRGIKGERIVTKARGGESNHNYGLAVDMYPVLPDASGKDKVFTEIPPKSSIEFARAFRRTQESIGEIAEELGLFWGARFSGIVDTPHIQLLAQHEMSPKECLKIFRKNSNTLQAVWDEASRRVRPL